jgi:hypothetical protein
MKPWPHRSALGPDWESSGHFLDFRVIREAIGRFDSSMPDPELPQYLYGTESTALYRRLRAATRLDLAISAQNLLLVGEMRAQDLAWRIIGTAAGVSEQAAITKYGSVVGALRQPSVDPDEDDRIVEQTAFNFASSTRRGKLRI